MKPFQLHLPRVQPLPIVASIPHSGLAITDEMAQLLHRRYQTYLPHQDWHLNKLYDFLPDLGVTVLEAKYSRYVVDLNRQAKKPFLGDFWSSVVPKKTAFNFPLYRITPSDIDVKARVEQFYYPYHHQLEQLLTQISAQFGQVYLFDLHSFSGPITDEVCLGNLNGQSCSDSFVSAVESAFSSGGYQVVRNKVFNGGHITRHYGQIPDVEALQIEIRYHTYLEPKQLEQTATPDWNFPRFYRAKSNLKNTFKVIAKSCTRYSETET